MSKQFNVNGETYEATPEDIEAMLAERLTGTDTDGEITIAGVDTGDKAASLFEALLNCAVKLYAMEELVEQGELERVRHGHWTETYIATEPIAFFRRRYVCSVCGDWQTYGFTKRCQKCAAVMDKPPEVDESWIRHLEQFEERHNAPPTEAEEAEHDGE